jgi:hypothetical protein
MSAFDVRLSQCRPSIVVSSNKILQIQVPSPSRGGLTQHAVSSTGQPGLRTDFDQIPRHESAVAIGTSWHSKRTSDSENAIAA